MKHLIVYTHPNPLSFNNALKDILVEVSNDKGHETVIRDLYELQFDPVLKGSDFVGFKSGNIPDDIKREQEFITWADMITFIYPIWWTGLPALLKGYIDRVLSYGFAYAYGDNGVIKLLPGKKVMILNTCGTPKDMYEATGMIKSMNQTSDEGIFEFCGIKRYSNENSIVEISFNYICIYTII